MKKVFLILAYLVSLFCLGYGLAAMAQTAPKVVTPKGGPLAVPTSPAGSAPAVPVALVKDYFKYQLAIRAAQTALQVGEANEKDTLKQIAEACGKDYQPSLDPETGEPVCKK